MSWLLVFLGFCFLIMVHEAGHFFAAKATGMRVERFFLFFGPTVWSFRRGETEYGVKAIPLGGYVKITGMNPEEDVPPEHAENAYFRKPAWKRIVVVAAGPLVNIVLAFLILVGVYTFATLEEGTQSIGRVLPKTAASGVLKPGDEIVAVDGSRYRNLSTEDRLTKFREEIGSHECAGEQRKGCVAETPVRLTIERGGRTLTLPVRPRYDPAAGQTLVGFGFAGRPYTMTPGEAVSRASGAIWEVTSRTGHLITHIFESKQRKQVSGVVGISDVGHEVVETGLQQSLLLLAFVSLSLGLINLLPILPLDGGHILWALVEKLRGGPVSLRVIERATVVGFALVLVLMFIGLSNDIGRITGEGFNVR
ncbi:MAG TPA: site-2 protease family protein [Solirubrobacterales bacterium]|nr:site-2 protease family protein [Solirubrobacterales bacterium]